MIGPTRPLAWSGPAWLSTAWLVFLGGFLLLELVVVVALVLTWSRRLREERARTRLLGEARELVTTTLAAAADRGQSHPRLIPSRRLLTLAPSLALVVEERCRRGGAAARAELAAALRPSLERLLAPLLAEGGSPLARLRGALVGRPRLERIMELLNALPEPRLLPQLLTLATSRHPAVACGATIALGQGGPAYAGAVIPLADTLREGAPASRLAVRWALKRLLATSPEMVEALASDPSSRVREVAADAIAELLAAGPSPREPELLNRLRATRNDPDEQVRAAGCRALRHAASPERVALLTRALADPGEKVVRTAARCLGEIGDAAALPALLQRLATAQAELREELLAALAAIPGGPSQQWLALARGGPTPQRRAAIMAIGTRAQPNLAEPLSELVGDPEPEVRREAARAITSLARTASAGSIPAPAVERLLDALDRESVRGVQTAIIDALAWAGGVDTTPALLQRIASGPAPLREQLLETIAFIEQRAGSGRR